jgi:type II secretory pathway component PulF
MKKKIAGVFGGLSSAYLLPLLASAYEINNSTLASSTELATSVATTLVTQVLAFLVVTISIGVGIFFLYWAVRKAMKAPKGKV